MHDCKTTLDGINRLDTSQEKISEFEDIVIETRMSCSSFLLTLYLDFLCYIFIGRILYFSEIYTVKDLGNINQWFWQKLLIPFTISNSCWFYTYNRKGSWHWTIFMTLGPRVSLLGKRSHYMALYLIVIY